MGVSKVTRNFQVTIPADIRQLIDIAEGDRVLFTATKGRLELRKLDDDLITRTAGLWKQCREDGKAYTRRVRSGWRKRS